MTKTQQQSEEELLSALGLIALLPGGAQQLGIVDPDISFKANPANYKYNPRGNVAGDLLIDGAAGLGTGLAKYDKAVTPFATAAQNKLTGLIGSAGGATKIGGAAGRMAGGAKALGLLKALPAFGAVGGVLGAADVIAGPDSGANKAMDATAMMIGGALGSVGGPLGALAGAGAGKMVSDATQFIFGDRKTAEQRRMEEALAALRGGMI